MRTDYDNIGIYFEEENDFFTFARKNAENMKYFETEEGEFAVLQIGENIQIWYYGDQNGLSPFSMEMFHKAPQNLQGVNAKWINMPKNNDSALLNIFIEGGDFPIPLNIEIIDAFLWRGCEDSVTEGIVNVETTLYAKQVNLIKKGEEPEPSMDRMARESLIPCGTFPARDDDENWRPSATALMNGLVEEANLLTNQLTQKNYWHLKVRCLGYTFFVVVSLEYVEGMIEAGDYIEGFYWISGKVCV